MPDRPKRRCQLPALMALAFLMPSAGAADTTWQDPHPMRLQAISEGREFTYNAESFLHRYSYRNLPGAPAPGEDGLYGTGGSITGDQLYVEINLQKTLHFDNDRYAIQARMQRREDFDGRFDRQLVGVWRRFGEQWQAGFLADITADKGAVDFQLEANWRPDEQRQLRLAVIQTDRLYNNKSNSGNKFQKSPTTFFAHYLQRSTGLGSLEFSVNYSPRADYDDRELGYAVEAEQVRLMGAAVVPLGAAWHGGLRLELEQSRRDYALLDQRQPIVADDFRRDSWHLIASATLGEHRWQPEFGLRYFELDEQGWFGTGLASSGSNRRDEWGLFASMQIATGERHWLAPSVHLQQVDFQRQFAQRPLDERDQSEVVGKLTLPWRVLINAENRAVLTFNPTFRLHRFAFGGGNVQLHWPF